MFASVLFGSLLASQALATGVGFKQVNEMGLSKRQTDESFVPGTTFGCPSGWPECGTSQVCYNPKRGDTCCPGGTYACPGGSFCLQDGYCCPDGLDRESCAKKFGVTLKPTTTAEPTTTSKPTPTDDTTTTTSTTSSKAVIPTTTTTSAGSSSSSTVPPPPSSAGPFSPPLFTAGANALAGAKAAVVIGAVGGLLAI
ncbi:uncharacterized protein BDW47DRAFT_126582 [Aspergillus candidus]|uniref:GPI anchored serine-threonine rich protein n=1 Tax=Aspergillus candidus TaxID=41067 RepID=A0A2I2F926_ASPCN|nr:hypothetical protein BDW47DRAFT_126582 [Aspergillus candidus]PLB37121.1 hypothetical protein BDW47DRAFT_126582 [Aspergillus candidus]